MGQLIFKLVTTLENGMFKDDTFNSEKNNIIYNFKCTHWEISKRFHLRMDYYVSKSIRNWTANKGNKPPKSPSAIRLLNYLEWSKHYNDKKFTILTEELNMYHLVFKNL